MSKLLTLILVVASAWSCQGFISWNFFPAATSSLFRIQRATSITSLADSNESAEASLMASAFDTTVQKRYACTRFQRFDGNATTTTMASPSDPSVVKQAWDCLDLARRAPSGFNAQPYKLLLVHSVEQKNSMARYCIGHNAHRVRDSDCTAVFLSDREVVRTGGYYTSFLRNKNPKFQGRKGAMLKIRLLIALFSSGYPVPRFLAVPVSFLVRTVMSILSILTLRRYPLPSLSGAETWSAKNTMLVAMTYLLGCTSRNLATCPMEGFNAGGIRRALGIPKRYSIPLIVSTGTPFVRPADISKTKRDSADDMGVSHGPDQGKGTFRFPVDEMLYMDRFGVSGVLPS